MSTEEPEAAPEPQPEAPPEPQPEAEAEPQPEAVPEPQPEAEAEAPPEPWPRRRGFRTGRLEAFSDGVFAIAITLLVLDIGVSATAGQDLGGAIRGLWPSYLAYVASFSTIGAAWLGHNAITE